MKNIHSILWNIKKEWNYDFFKKYFKKKYLQVMLKLKIFDTFTQQAEFESTHII